MRRVRQRRFWLSMVAGIMMWLMVGGVVYFFAPEGAGVVGVFYLMVFLASYWSITLLSNSRRRGLLAGGWVAGVLLMRQYGVGGWWNVGLWSGFLVCVEVYVTKFRHENEVRWGGKNDT